MMIREFAMKWHGDQKYAGMPYVVHLDLVHQVHLEFGYRSENDMLNAYCHDLLEDTDVPQAELIAATNDRVYDMVWAVTGIGNTRADRTKNTIEKLEIIRDAIPLKMADRLANMRFSSKNSRKHINKYIDELPKYGKVFFGPMYEEMKLFQKVPE